MLNPLLAALLVLAGCGCGSEQYGTLTVYVTDEQYAQLLDVNGSSALEACVSACEQQRAFESIDACTTTRVEAADAVDTGLPADPIWLLDCHGSSTLICE